MDSQHITYYVRYLEDTKAFFLYEIYEENGELNSREIMYADNGTMEYSALYFMQQAQNLIKGLAG